MNKVTIKIEITRAAPDRCQFEMSMSGQGDDAVQSLADAIHEGIAERLKTLARKRGGFVKRHGPKQG